MDLRQTKILLSWGYRSDHPQYGLDVETFFYSLTFGVDNYSTYDKFLRAGDFNIPSGDDPLQNLLTDIDSNCLVKVPTCIKNVESPSTITNCPL